MFQITVSGYSLNFKPSLILPKNKTHLIYNCSMCEKSGKSRGGVYLFLQLVEDKFNDDVILKAKDLCHALGDPGLDDFQVDLGHIHLLTHHKTKRIFHILFWGNFQLLFGLIQYYINYLVKNYSILHGPSRIILKFWCSKIF